MRPSTARKDAARRHGVAATVAAPDSALPWLDRFYDEAACRSCGVCAAGCKDGALSMNLREGAASVPGQNAHDSDRRDIQ